MLIVPATPSTSAVIVALPPPTAVTRPFPSTVIVFGSDELQLTLRPKSCVAPLYAAAVSCRVELTSSGPSTVELTTTEVTGTTTGLTVMLLDPDTPSTMALIVALPAARAVTRPLASTVATDSSDELHVGARPGCGALPAIATAVSCWMPPTSIVADAGVTFTAVILGSTTVIVLVPLTPSTVALIVATPAARPVTRPFASVVAIDSSDECHDVARPACGTVPAIAAAASCCVAP